MNHYIIVNKEIYDNYIYHKNKKITNENDNNIKKRSGQ